MEFKDKLRKTLEESFGVNLKPIAQDVSPEIEEGDVKLGGEEMRLANKEAFKSAVDNMPDEEWSAWIVKATTNRGLDKLADYLPGKDGDEDALPDENGQPPANDVGDLSGLVDEPEDVEVEPDVDVDIDPDAAGDDEDLDINLEEDGYNLNL